MKCQVWGRYAMAGVLVAGMAAATGSLQASTGPVTDAGLVKQISHEILTYPHYTMWDDISIRVNQGQVELMGAVTQPYKKSDIQRMVQRTPGVTSVTDDIKVLPLSPNDNRIRHAVASAIFRDPILSRYAAGPIPQIHIIVDNGRVTLTGVVANQGDKNLAGIRANGAGMNFGVTNDLQVANSSRRG